jgi:hypothetical protein
MATVARRELLKACGAMLGVALSPVCVRAALSRQSPSLRAIDPRLRPAIAALADLILPKTGTPGAVEAGVPQFVESLLTGWYTDEEVGRFASGLAWLDEACRQRATEGFALAPPDVRAAAFEAAGESPGEVRAFFEMAREAVVVGYFTSETGAGQVLAYVPVPGRYDGAFPVGQASGHRSN